MKKLALALPAVVGCTALASVDAQTWVPVERGDLIIEVDVTGVLKAMRASPLNSPTIHDMNDFKIVKMLPEGSEVKQGTPTMILDTSEMEQWLKERKVACDRVTKELAQKQNDLELSRRDANMKVAEADAALRKAQLKADLPPQYTADVTMKLAKLDAESAEAELRMTKARRDHLMRLGEAELAYLRERVQVAEGKVREVEAAIGQMAVRAPVSGLVVYRNNWRGEKKKVGDSCWGGDACLEIADVSEMFAKGHVDETESAHVAVGQRVTLRLEAFPEIEWGATVQRLRSHVYRQSPLTPIKVIGVDLALQKTDPARMRPQMQFRGRIQVDHVSNALMIPLDAIFPRGSGPVAFRKTATGFQAVPLRLGKRNRSHAEVLRGLSISDRVARRDLERDDPGT